MSRLIKKGISIFLCLILSFGLTSCDKYDRPSVKADIREYLKENYGLGFTEYSIKLKNRHIPYYSIKRWEIYDKKEKILFFVDDEASSTILTPRHDYGDNYGAALLNKYFSKYNDNENLSLKKLKTEDGSFDNAVYLNYSNRKELEQGYNSFLKIASKINKKRSNVRLHLITKYNFPGRENLEEDYSDCEYEANFSDDFGDYSIHGNLSELVEGKSKALRSFIGATIAFHIEKNLDSISYTERDRYMRADGTPRIIVEETDVPYDDIVGYSFNITVPTLYNILKAENYQLDGDRNHFKFTNKDGHSFEFSTDFLYKDETLTCEELQSSYDEKVATLKKAIKEDWDPGKIEKEMNRIAKKYEFKKTTDPYPLYYICDGKKVVDKYGTVDTRSMSDENLSLLGYDIKSTHLTYIQQITCLNLKIDYNKNINKRKNN